MEAEVVEEGVAQLLARALGMVQVKVQGVVRGMAVMEEAVVVEVEGEVAVVEQV